MKHSQNFNFNSTKALKRPRKWKNKCHESNVTMPSALIVPLEWDINQIGDTYNNKLHTYCRTMPLESTLFSKMDMKQRMYCVPLRKIQPDFEEYRMSLPSDDRKAIYTTILNILQYSTSGPVYTYNFDDNTLLDYMGLPDVIRNWIIINNSTVHSQSDPDYIDPDNFDRNIVISNLLQHYRKDDTLGKYATSLLDRPVNLWPFIAYQKIYYDWYVDLRFSPDLYEAFFEGVMESHTYPLITVNDSFTYVWEGSSHSVSTLAFILQQHTVNKPKDYFTTCSDGSQQGPELVLMQQKLDIYGTVNSYLGGGTPQQVGVGHPNVFDDPSQVPAELKMQTVGFYLGDDGNQQGQFKVGEAWAQINQADLLTPSKIRWQEALQRMLERRNSTGTRRYSDFAFGQFGIRIPEPYLQRSIYVGGSVAPVIVDEVLATSDGNTGEGGDQSRLGEFVGRGFYKSHSRGLSCYTVEDTIVMTLAFIQPQQYYFEGLRRDFFNLDNLSLFPNSDFQNVGEEPVLMDEIFYGTPDNKIFGYNYRYAGNQMKLDELHGDFRNSLRNWTTAVRIGPPSLGEAFLTVTRGQGNQVFAYNDYRANPFLVRINFETWHKMPLSNFKAEGRIG